MSANNPNDISIRLDISIPTDGVRPVKAAQFSLPRGQDPDRRFYNVIQHPPSGDTYAKNVNGTWMICAYGTSSSDIVFVEVYDGHVGVPSGQPSGDEWHRLPNSSSGIWRFEELPIPGPVNPGGSPKTLVLWPCDDGVYGEPISRQFAAHPATYTYCDYYESAPSAIATLAGQSSGRAVCSMMPTSWEFSVAGCTNQLCKNCDCLNGTWIVTCKDTTADQPIWHCPMKTSFADPAHPSYWRLSFNHNDGFWYLEVVGNLVQQMQGTWIAYSCHEGKWKPSDVNVMQFLTNNGYCNVPDSITIKPLQR